MKKNETTQKPETNAIKNYLQAVLRINDILAWIMIRIWIPGSMPLTNGSGSGSCYFWNWPSRCHKKKFDKKNFLLLLFEGTFTSFFKKSKRSHNSLSSRNQGFSYYFYLVIYGKDPDPYLWSESRNPGGPKIYGSDGSEFGSGSETLLTRIQISRQQVHNKIQ